VGKSRSGVIDQYWVDYLSAWTAERLTAGTDRRIGTTGIKFFSYFLASDAEVLVAGYQESLDQVALSTGTKITLLDYSARRVKSPWSLALVA
jgi:hypothetical protein